MPHCRRAAASRVGAYGGRLEMKCRTSGEGGLLWQVLGASQRQPVGPRTGAGLVQGAPLAPPLKGVAHALAIDCYHLAQGQLLHLPLNTVFKRSDIQARPYPTESVVGRNSRLQIQHLCPLLLSGLTEVRNFQPIVSSASYSSNGHDQGVLQPMWFPAFDPRVFQLPTLFDQRRCVAVGHESTPPLWAGHS